MKRITILLALFMVQQLAQAQQFHERLAAELCKCIGEAETIDQLEEELNNCYASSVEVVLADASTEEREMYNLTGSMQQIMDDVQEVLPQYCEKVRNLALDMRREIYYSLSVDDRANRFFEAGNEAMMDGYYRMAIRRYKKALKIDPEFVLALDHMGICYRNLGDLPTAIHSYEQSLDIYPEGELSLTNLAMAYAMLPDYRKSLDIYGILTKIYPYNPEGYFGIARISFLENDYERSLDHVFVAHRLYTEEDSEYQEESALLMGDLYKILKERDELELFFAKADEHGINIKME